ncbi:cyclic nucleotide-binding domain-containing protein [Thiocystis violascens]|uniref:Rhodanese-related sulfurtransferase n=1 Tax=Thiocystis violascens (strain ATCC 17096 / DSM 198 / 6111) TaxID=765911 RepID=I3YEP8_THIV6|nr:cyclic nucleotide-binding domain-containing protein [Thiocystis violascens]AFL75466.1 Rhodanese-related sulfurtransferase [Thiocystis violascens DSM 198]
MSIKTSHVLRILRERFHAFPGISERALLESLQIFRLFELREGERLRLTGSELPDRLYVAVGRVAVTDAAGHRQDVAASERGYVVLPPLPAAVTVEALEDSHLCHLDTGLADYLLTLEEVAESLVASGSSHGDDLRLVRDTAPFRRIPLENAERALTSLRERPVQAGEEVVKMGKETNAFFVVVAGRAELWQIDDEEGIPMKAAELERGATFGEESLLTGKLSAVTVRMLEDGVLLQLARDDFAQLLARPLVREVDAPVAKAMIENNSVALDVRLEEEFDEGHIPGAVLIPLSQLRKRAGELDSAARYVAYCRSGRRSSVAAFQLSQRGYEVVSMAGGVLAWSDPLTEPVE